MHNNRTGQRPQTATVQRAPRGDTLTPASAPRHDRSADGTSREDMRRDTQRPERSSGSATNALRLY
jgi:hypothetical protein